MKKRQAFSMQNRLRSFIYAFNGLYHAFRTEHNLLIHAAATVCVVIASITAAVSKIEFAILCLAIGMVWVAELFNTAIERLADFVSPEKQQAIGVIKDIAAAAVLVTAITALAVACFIFIPKC